jgi:hypothetical protein
MTFKVNQMWQTTKINLKSTLEKYGVAQIDGVLNEEECLAVKSGIWDYFEHLTCNRLNRNDAKTWRAVYDLFPLHSMLFQHYSVGHSQVVWDVRQNPKVADVYAEMYSCKVEDLVVSFDGLSFSLPHEVTKRGYFRGNLWMHTDQSYTRNNFECIQSWVTAEDVDGDKDATLAVLVGSHKYHAEFAEKYNMTDKSDWYKLNSEQQQFYLDKGCYFARISCPKGGMVFWDSRTIHCGIEAVKGRKKIRTRYVIYVCYMPRNMCSESQLKKKQKAFNEMRTTSHWPNKAKLFAKHPRTYGNPLPEIQLPDSPVLTELGLKLAGF